MVDNADSDNDEFKQIAEANFMKISTNLTKIGYTDGITEGSELAFQRGFDVGYEDGLKMGFEIAKYKSLVKELKTEENSALRDELDLFNSNLEDLNPLSKENLKFLSSSKNVDDITKLQTTNFNTVASSLKTNYPKINELI